MKRVVVVSADFPPSSMPSALRARCLIQHLLEFGWEPIVITIDPRYYEQPIDPENERLLPDSLEIIRVSAVPARLSRLIGIGDVGMRGLGALWRALESICRQRAVDVVLFSVPPNVPMILGRKVWSRFGIPYVIDYQDPWVTEYYWQLPIKQRPPKWALAYALSRILEPVALKQVSHLIGVSKGTIDRVVERYPWLAGLDFTVLPVGAEPADFDYVRSHSRDHRIFDHRDELLHISYVGGCLPAMYETVRAFLAAVALGLTRNPGLFKRLRLHFVGTTYAPHADRLFQVVPIAREVGVEGLVFEHPARIPYLSALQVLLDSHALVMLGSDAPHYTASKLFPYILAQKPLLAVFHEASSVITILKETQAGRVITFGLHSPVRERIDEISRLLEETLLLPPDYRPPIRWGAFEPYTARAISSQLAEALEKALVKGKGNI